MRYPEGVKRVRFETAAEGEDRARVGELVLIAVVGLAAGLGLANWGAQRTRPAPTPAMPEPTAPADTGGGAPGDGSHGDALAAVSDPGARSRKTADTPTGGRAGGHDSQHTGRDNEPETTPDDGQAGTGSDATTRARAGQPLPKPTAARPASGGPNATTGAGAAPTAQGPRPAGQAPPPTAAAVPAQATRGRASAVAGTATGPPPTEAASATAPGRARAAPATAQQPPPAKSPGAPVMRIRPAQPKARTQAAAERQASRSQAGPARAGRPGATARGPARPAKPAGPAANKPPPAATQGPGATPIIDPAASRFKLGRVAYLRCKGIEKPDARYPCPRDRKLELRAGAVLHDLSTCAAADDLHGKGDVRLSFVNGREWPEVLWAAAYTSLPIATLEACVGRRLRGLRTTLRASHLLVSVRFQLK